MAEPRRSANAATAAEAYYRNIPFRLGESPYTTRGIAWVFHDEFVRERLEGGPDAQRSALGGLADDPFWTELKLASGSYDVLPLVACGYACGEVTGTSMYEFCKLRSVHQAQRDLTSIRRLLLTLLTPSMVARRFPFLLRSYFNFGEPGAEAIDGGVRMFMRHVPSIIAEWLEAVCHGFVVYAIETTGAAVLSAQGNFVPTGIDQYGSAEGDIVFEIRWA